MLPVHTCLFLPLMSRTAFAVPDDESQDLYNHPLLIGEIQPEVAERLATEDVADVLRDVVIYDEMIEHADGTFESRSVVALPERTAEEHEATEEQALDYPLLHPVVSEWMADPASAGPGVDIWITYALYQEFEPMMARFAIAVANGEVLSNADAWDVRQALIAERREAALAELDPVVRDLEGLGAEIIDLVPSAGLVRVVVDAAFLEELASRTDITAIEPAGIPDEDDDDGVGWSVFGTNIDGYELTDLIQAQQFYAVGYYGRTTEIMTLAETSGDNVRRAHPGFEDGFGVDRFSNCPGSGTSCTSNPNPSTGSDHATATASVLLGDITRGQDTAVTCTGTTCEQRSGVSRSARANGVSTNTWGQVDWAATTYSYILSESSTNDTDDPSCTGATSRTRAWNAMYEDGVALFNSNGNNGNTSTTDCTIAAPATAMGVVAVAAYDTSPSNTPADAPALRTSTSRGGTSTQGVRTISALTAPNNILYPYNNAASSSFDYGADWAPTDGNPDNFTASSAATPVVAGAANVYRHWYRIQNSTLIDDPGILYAEMLLMGDRRFSNSGLKVVEGYSNLWGAGVLRLRKYDADGLDSWAQHNVGNVCVGHGTVVVPITTSSAVPEDVDYAKAVAWWYDDRHDDSGNGSGEFDRVALYLQRLDPSTGSWITLRDDMADNNYLRTYYSDPGAWTLRLQLSGSDVTQDNGGCGSNSVKVYWAWIVEDNDRDDDTNLADTVRPE